MTGEGPYRSFVAHQTYVGASLSVVMVGSGDAGHGRQSRRSSVAMEPSHTGKKRKVGSPDVL